MAVAGKAHHKTQKVKFPRRGEIYLVAFDPTVGAEIQKTRPALIIQNDISNEHSPLCIVAAITSKFDLPSYPTEVVMDQKESGLLKPSAVLLNQIRSVDRARLIKRIGQADVRTMLRVDHALKISLSLIKI